MNNLAMWSVIVGFAMPALIALINQTRWTKPLKGLVAFILCVLAAFVTVWLRGELTGATWTTSTLIVFGAAITTYHTWWRPSGIAPSIEAATSTR